MDIHFVATALTTAFTIIDPLGMIPLSLAVTATNTPDERRAIVDRAVLVAAIIIFVMAVLGRAIFDYLGVTLSAFTIAGGILLFLIAVDMLFARPTVPSKTSLTKERAATRPTSRSSRLRSR